MVYTASKGGHAPGHLREALLEALDRGGNKVHWWDTLVDNEVIHFTDPDKQAWWNALTAEQRGRWLLGQLWNCSDILDGTVVQEQEINGRHTYAVLARKLRADFN